MIVTSVAEDDLGHGVALALQDAVQGGSPDAAARIVISALRNTSYNLSQLLDECASAKDESLRQIGLPIKYLEHGAELTTSLQWCVANGLIIRA